MSLYCYTESNVVKRRHSSSAIAWLGAPGDRTKVYCSVDYSTVEVSISFALTTARTAAGTSTPRRAVLWLSVRSRTRSRTDRSPNRWFGRVAWRGVAHPVWFRLTGPPCRAVLCCAVLVRVAWVCPTPCTPCLCLLRDWLTAVCHTGLGGLLSPDLTADLSGPGLGTVPRVARSAAHHATPQYGV